MPGFPSQRASNPMAYVAFPWHNVYIQTTCPLSIQMHFPVPVNNLNYSTNIYTWNIPICCRSSPGHTWSSCWAHVLHYGVFCTPLTVHLNARVNSDGQHYGQITVTGRAGYHEIFIEITVTYISGNGVQHMVKEIQSVCQGRHEDSGARSRCLMHG